MSEPASETERQTITIHELLERSAESALELQREDGSYPPGRNYTYDEPETPVRTTSHWTVTISEVYDITGKEKFREAADAAVDYLLSQEVRPHGYTYYCRDAPGKDSCNGLVGQAAPIRALTHAGSILDRQDAIDTAEEVFMIHPFDEELGLWECVEIDGKKLSFDRTLNHQILFAADSSKLSLESDVVADRIKMFLDHLPYNIRLHPDGTIKHYIKPPVLETMNAVIREPRHWRLIVNGVAFYYYSLSRERKRKEIGYQPTNLRGLSKLRLQFPEHDTWSHTRIQSVLKTLNAVENSPEEYGSVIPGICLALANFAFRNDTECVKSLVKQDLESNLDRDTYFLKSKNVQNIDKTSIISHLVDLPDSDIPL